MEKDETTKLPLNTDEDAMVVEPQTLEEGGAETQSSEEGGSGEKVSLVAGKPDGGPLPTACSNASSSAGSSEARQPSFTPGATGSTGPVNTLEEPVMTTITRELKSILSKLMCVIKPQKYEGQVTPLRDWDLWGPLILCLTLGSIVSARESPADQKPEGYSFALVFITVWIGSFVVTVNAILLGGRVPFFVSMCTLGYCLLPLVAAELLFVSMQTLKIQFAGPALKVVLVLLALGWSTFAASRLLGKMVEDDRKLLGSYPVCLFYGAIAWVILVA